MSRCDTDPFWFLFASCGRPFMYADPQSASALQVFKAERRRHKGCSVEQRCGNYAAGTMEELTKAWPGKAKMTVAKDGSFVHVEPHDFWEKTA